MMIAVYLSDDIISNEWSCRNRFVYLGSGIFSILFVMTSVSNEEWVSRKRITTIRSTPSLHGLFEPARVQLKQRHRASIQSHGLCTPDWNYKLELSTEKLGNVASKHRQDRCQRRSESGRQHHLKTDVPTSTNPNDGIGSGVHYAMVGASFCPELVSILNRLGFKRVSRRQSWHLKWVNDVVPSSRDLAVGGAFQRINRWPALSVLTRINILPTLLLRRGIRQGVRRVFVLPQDRAKLVQACDRCPSATWLCQSPADDALPPMKSVLSEVPISRRTGHSVISRAIRRLKVDGKDVVVCMYVAITSFDPVRVYVHREAVVKISNGAVKGIWNGDELQDRLSKCGIQSRKLWTQMHDLIVMTALVLEEPVVRTLSQLAQSWAGSHFGLLRFDFVVDEAGKPWISKVHEAPHRLELNLVRANIVEDLLTMVGIEARDSGEDEHWRRNHALLPSVWMNGRDWAESPAQALLHAIAENSRAEALRSGSFQRLFPMADWDRFRNLVRPGIQAINGFQCHQVRRERRPRFRNRLSEQKP